MSTPLIDDQIHGGVSIDFSAKLPDDISAEEFASLLNAIAVLDAGAVTVLRESPEAKLLNFPVRSIEPSTVLRVRYGSDFQVILDAVVEFGVPMSMVVGAWLSITKGLDFLANARLKNEERLGKRDERLAKRVERARVREIVSRRRFWMLGSTAFEVSGDEIELPAHEEPGDAGSPADWETRRENALDSLMPREAREGVEANLPSWLNADELMIALAELAEYEVKIRISGTRPASSA